MRPGIPFLLLIIITAAMAVMSCAGASVNMYSSWWMIALWAAMAITSLIVVFHRHLRGATMLLHLAFAVILAGAALTHFLGSDTTVTLQPGVPTEIDGKQVVLNDFSTEYYPGSAAPADFIARLSVDGRDVTVSMNHVWRSGTMQLTMQGYNNEGGVTLRATSDAAGLYVTYIGYALLLLAMLGYLLKPGTMWRRAISAMTLLLMTPILTNAAPKGLPDSLVARYETLPVEHAGRIAPFSSVARDMLTTVYGAPTWHGNSATAVATGMMYHFDSWRDQPLIKVKSERLRKQLGLTSKYASYQQMYDAITSHRFDPAEAEFRTDMAKVAAIDALVGRRAVKAFPSVGPEGDVHWWSASERITADADSAAWRMSRNLSASVNEMIQQSRYGEAAALLSALEAYQQSVVGEHYPSRAALRLEQVYFNISPLLPWGAGAVTAGIVLTICILICNRRSKLWRRLATGLTVAVTIWLTALIALRWRITGQLPLTNGFETMQLMAWLAAMAGIVMQRRWELGTAMGLIVSGLAMLVASFSGAGSTLTPMMPVLASPLLSIHVLAVMTSYTLLAFMALIGVIGLCSKRRSERLAHLNTALSVPAIFLLAAGIFIGAVWANVSWGRYWGWDPKEGWALITMIIYSLSLHPRTLTWLSKPRARHIFFVAAFASVLITYFGVNYLLGGLHSYA